MVVVEIVEVLLLLLLLLLLFLLIAGETMGQGRTPLGIEELRARGIEGGYNPSLSTHGSTTALYSELALEYLLFWHYKTLNSVKEIQMSNSHSKIAK